MNYKFEIDDFAKKISKNKKVIAIYLFGSYLKNFGTCSDIDFCVIGKLNSNEKKRILRETPERFDISFFDEIPIFIKVRVFKEGKGLFVRNKRIVEEIKMDTLKEYREFMFFMKRRMVEMFGNVW